MKLLLIELLLINLLSVESTEQIVTVQHGSFVILTNAYVEMQILMQLCVIIKNRLQQF